MNLRMFFYTLAFLLLVSTTFRVSNFVDNIQHKGPEKPNFSVASAEDKKEDTSEKKQDDMAHVGGALVEEEEVKIPLAEKDPLQPKFSQAELAVLQKLSARREALDQRERELDETKRLLEATEKRLETKYEELSSLKTEISELLDKQQNIQNERMKQLVKIYETMKPKDAANIFNELDFDVLMQIIQRMSERRTAPIIAAMDPRRARNLSAKLAEQMALPKVDDLSGSE